MADTLAIHRSRRGAFGHGSQALNPNGISFAPAAAPSPCVCGMSSQGQALPALASPASPPTLLSRPHLLPPAMFLCALFLLPALDTLCCFSLTLLSAFPLKFLFPLLLPFFYVSPCVSIFPCPPHPNPNRSPLCPEAPRVAARIYSSPPPNTRPAWQVQP